jgi:hypothetical protein
VAGVIVFAVLFGVAKGYPGAPGIRRHLYGQAP